MLIDLTGLEVKHWKVIERVGKKYPAKWKCQCMNCGQYKTILGQLIREKRPGPCHYCNTGWVHRTIEEK